MAKFSKELHKADGRLPLSFMRYLNSAVIQKCHVAWCLHSSQLGELSVQTDWGQRCHITTPGGFRKRRGGGEALGHTAVRGTLSSCQKCQLCPNITVTNSWRRKVLAMVK